MMRILIHFYTIYSMTPQTIGNAIKAQGIQVLYFCYSHSISFHNFPSYLDDKIDSGTLNKGNLSYTSWMRQAYRPGIYYHLLLHFPFCSLLFFCSHNLRCTKNNKKMVLWILCLYLLHSMMMRTIWGNTLKSCNSSVHLMAL